MSAESHGLELGKEYELNIGSSFFTSKPKEAYHLMRYDFKPASIDTTRPAVFEVGEKNECTVTLPNVQDSGSSESKYKGGKKPCVKECVLIIDKVTGQITLERITSSIPLKKCRADKQSTMAKAHSEMENMESLEKSSGNIKKMLKGRLDKVEKKNPPPSKSTSKDTSSSTSKDTSSSTSSSSTSGAGKSSKPSSQNAPTTCTPSVPTQPSNTTLASSNTMPSITSNATSSSISGTSTVPVKQHPPSGGAVPPKRQMSSSDMSVSSASSDSSDSDSSDEGGDSLEKQLAATTTTTTTTTPSKPPPPAPLSKPSKPPPPPPKSVSSSFGKSETKIEQSPAKQITSSAPLAKEATVKGKEKSFLNTLQSDLQLSDSDSDSD